MSLGQLRALVYVPIRFISDPKAAIEFHRSPPVLRPSVAKICDWSDGPLDVLTQSRIPGTPFNRSIYIDLPQQLRGLLGFQAISPDDLRSMGKQVVTRKHLNLIDAQFPVGIDGIYCDAVELLNFPLSFQSNTFDKNLGLLVLHLHASEAQTNLENIESLSRLQNTPIRKILNSLFRTNFETDIPIDESSSKLPNIYDQNLEAGGKSLYELSADVSWIIVPEIERTNLVIYSMSGELTYSFGGGNLHITDDHSDQNLARFRSKMVFLGALLNFLKAQSDVFQQCWPILLDKSDSEVIEIRTWLESFCNSWWWKKISYDEYLQDAYMKWTEALRIEAVIESLRADLREFWAIRTMQNSVETAEKIAHESEELKRLNELAKLFAIFGIIPAWLGLLFADLPKYVAPMASLIIVAYLGIKPRKVLSVISKLQIRIRSK